MDKVLVSQNERILAADLMALQGYADTIMRELFRGVIGQATVLRGYTVVPSTGMAVVVQKGTPDAVALSEGGAVIRLTADTPLTIAAADPTYPRIDLVTIAAATVDGQAETRDFYSGGSVVPQVTNKKRSDGLTLQVTAGTPAAAPVAPAAPADSITIAQVLVPLGATQATQFTITDTRPVLRTLMGLNTEVLTARGTKGTLDSRLDVALNEDGTLKQVIPPGLTAFFPGLTECPTGWSVYAPLRGRYAVGLVSGGTVDAAVGTPLTNMESRVAGQHNHGVNDPTHTHTHADAGHNHGVYDPWHGHSVSDPTHGHAVNDPTHAHVPLSGAGFLVNVPASRSHTLPGGSQVGFENTGNVATGIWLSGAPTGIGVNAGPSNIGLYPSGVGTWSNANPTGVTIQNTGNVAGTPAPFIQLLPCRKD